MKNLTWVISLGLCLGVSQMGSYVVAADLEGNEESLYSGNMLDPNKWIRRMAVSYTHLTLPTNREV